jgi:hypothetical protein
VSCDSCFYGELPVAVVALGDATWHDGPGWYQWDAEYPDEGSSGAFYAREEAEKFARDSGYCLESDDDKSCPNCRKTRNSLGAR